jgi:dihydrofolate synthase/folylpolyglutamate synthase
MTDDIGMRLADLRIGMLGQHQIGNACLALASAECVSKAGMTVPDAAMRTGLANVVWEGRLERVAERPDIYLDGAHNPASARVLADAVRDLKKGYRHLVLVIAFLWTGLPGIVAQPPAGRPDRQRRTIPALGVGSWRRRSGCSIAR